MTGEDEARVDLHLHSTASDGTVSPAEVVRRAAAEGLDGIALTDHDTVDGVEEAATEARRLGLRFLVGAELSANEPDRSVHVLAYGFDPSNPELARFFREYREHREERAREIVERFRHLGVSLEYRDVEREAGDGVPTRAHVARALVRKGEAENEREVFDRWLGRDGPAYVGKRPTPPASVFELIHGAGGVSVLAHPGWHHGPEEIRRWAAEGLDGVEVRHPANHGKVRRRLEELADELDLLRSGGSDWHGPDADRAPLGAESVPGAWMDRLERAIDTKRGSPTNTSDDA